MGDVGVEISIDPTVGVVLLRWEGVVTIADLQRARGEVMATPGWSKTFAHILDFTNVSALELSQQDVETLANATPIFAPDALQILVAKAGSVQFGLSRMLCTYADGKRRVHVVSSLEEAMALV